VETFDRTYSDKALRVRIQKALAIDDLKKKGQGAAAARRTRDPPRSNAEHSPTRSDKITKPTHRPLIRNGSLSAGYGRFGRPPIGKRLAAQCFSAFFAFSITHARAAAMSVQYDPESRSSHIVRQQAV
jgi:hypothetical protein